MLGRLKSWAESLSADTADKPEPPGASELAVATALLLAEAATLDGDFDDAEEDVIRTLLIDRLEVPPGEADEIVAEARNRADGHLELYGLTRTIKDNLQPEERTAIMEMLWEVVYADGELHDFESNLARRVAGLLHVTDRDSGAARKRVLARLEQSANPA